MIESEHGIPSGDPPYVGIGRVIEPPVVPAPAREPKVYAPKDVKMTFNGQEIVGFLHDPVVTLDELPRHDPATRTLSGLKFRVTLSPIVRTWTFSFPIAWSRKARRKQRLQMRRRRGRGACSS